MKVTKYECDKCHRYFVSIDKLDEHIKIYHELNIKSVLEKHVEELNMPIKEPPGEDAFKCDQCNYETNFERVLKRHKVQKHGAEPVARSTIYRRGVAATKAAEAEVPDSDWRSLAEKMVQENQSLSARVAELTKKNYTLAEELTVARDAAQGGPTQKERELAEQLRHLTVQNNLMAHDIETLKKRIQVQLNGSGTEDLQKLRLYLDGDPDGTTDEARLGFKRCYEIALQANEKLREENTQAKQGIIPESWLKDIKRDLVDSLTMVVEAIQESAKDSTKVRKYDDLMRMINEN